MISIKITIRFLTNEIRADGLKLLYIKKMCRSTNVFSKKISSALENELQVAILKRQLIFEKQDIHF